MSASDCEVEMRSGFWNVPDCVEDPGTFLVQPEAHPRASQSSNRHNLPNPPPQPANYEWGARAPQGAPWLGLWLDQSLENKTRYHRLRPFWAVSWRATQCV